MESNRLPADPPQRPKRCGARCRNGRPCQAWAIWPAGRCRMHNGKARRGIAHPNFKHGRRSKDFLTRVMAERAAQKPDMSGFARPVDNKQPAPTPAPEIHPRILDDVSQGKAKEEGNPSGNFPEGKTSGKLSRRF